MKVAMMVRGHIMVPRPKDMIYAPIDLAVELAQGLVRRGHSVDFYAPKGSKVGGGVNLVTLGLSPLSTDYREFQGMITDIDIMVHGIPIVWDEFMAQTMATRAARGDYDILHFHHPEIAMITARQFPKVPFVSTLHDPLTGWFKETLDNFKTPNHQYISISNNQRRDAPDLPYLSTVYNGVNLKRFEFQKKAEDYLIYGGRITPDKGVREAVRVAKATHHRLLIIGPTYPSTQDYFDKHIKPFLDDQILYLGYLDQTDAYKYYSRAKAFLTPVQWEEPFGMTTIEAMACGTPVISFRRGAAPEIIVDGKTGFVVDSTEEMIEAVHKINKIKRADCRDHVVANFSINHMVQGYESAFEKMLAERKVMSPRFVRRQLSNIPKRLRDTSSRRRLNKLIKTSPLAVKPKRPQ